MLSGSHPTQSEFTSVIKPRVDQLLENLELKATIEPRIKDFKPSPKNMTKGQKDEIAKYNQKQPIKSLLILFKSEDERDLAKAYIEKVGSKVIFSGYTKEKRGEIYPPILEIDIHFFMPKKQTEQKLALHKMNTLLDILNLVATVTLQNKNFKEGDEKHNSIQPIDFIKVTLRKDSALLLNKFIRQYQLISNCIFEDDTSPSNTLIHLKPDFLEITKGRLVNPNWDRIIQICGSMFSLPPNLFLARLSEILEFYKITNASELNEKLIFILKARSLPNPEDIDLMNLHPYIVRAIKECFKNLEMTLKKIVSEHSRSAADIIIETFLNLNLSFQTPAKKLLAYGKILKDILPLPYCEEETYQKNNFTRMMHELYLEEKSPQSVTPIENFNKLSPEEKNYQLFKIYYRLVNLIHKEEKSSIKKIHSKINKLVKTYIYQNTIKIDEDILKVLDLAYEELLNLNSSPMHIRETIKFNLSSSFEDELYIPLDRSKKLTIEDISTAYTRASGNPNLILEQFYHDLSDFIKSSGKQIDPLWLEKFIMTLPVPSCIELNVKGDDHLKKTIQYYTSKRWHQSYGNLKKDLEGLYKEFQDSKDQESSPQWFERIANLMEKNFPNIHKATPVNNFEFLKSMIFIYSSINKFKLKPTSKQQITHPFLCALCEVRDTHLAIERGETITPKPLTLLTLEERDFAFWKLSTACMAAYGPFITIINCIVSCLKNSSFFTIVQDYEDLPEVIFLLEALRPDKESTGAEYGRLMRQWLKEDKSSIPYFIASLYFKYLSEAYNFPSVKLTFFKNPLYLKSSLSGNIEEVRMQYQSTPQRFHKIENEKTIIDRIFLEAKISFSNVEKFNETIQYLISQDIPVNSIFKKDTWDKLNQDPYTKKLIQDNFIALLLSGVNYIIQHDMPQDWHPNIKKAIPFTSQSLQLLSILSRAFNQDLKNNTSVTTFTMAKTILKKILPQNILKQLSIANLEKLTQPTAFVTTLISNMEALLIKLTKEDMIDEDTFKLKFCLNLIKKNSENLPEIIIRQTQFPEPVVGIVTEYTGPWFALR